MDRAGSVRRGKVAEMEALHKRLVHLERIKKIKQRKSCYADKPEVIAALYSNPRKEALKREFNRTTEQENKCLLQRISKILTAPPKITDKDYQLMRSLCPSMRGLREKYEQAIIEREHNKFMAHLKTLEAYYKPQEWEQDYKRQLRNQKFMRQVNYKRPKGFIDPFAPNEKKVDPPPRAKSAAHVHRVKSFKDEDGKGDSRGTRPKSSGGDGSGGVHQKNSKKGGGASSSDQHLTASTQSSAAVADELPAVQPPGALRREGSMRKSSFMNSSFNSAFGLEDGGAAPRGGAGDDGDERKTELAQVQREIAVHVENEENAFYGIGEDQNRIEVNLPAVMTCWLINETSLVISAVARQGGNTLEAEAEVSVENIVKIKCLDPEVAQDILQLEALANDIIETVEMKVEDGLPRLILNLTEEEYSVVFSHASDEEINNLLLDDDVATKYTEGIRLHLKEIRLQQQQQPQLQQNQQRSSKKELDMAASSTTQSPIQRGRSSYVTATSEAIFAIVTAKTISDPDKAELSFFFPFGSKMRGKRQVNGRVGDHILQPNSRLTTIIGLPSIMQADSELVIEFFQNIVNKYAVEWNSENNHLELALLPDAK